MAIPWQQHLRINAPALLILFPPNVEWRTHSSRPRLRYRLPTSHRPSLKARNRYRTSWRFAPPDIFPPKPYPLVLSTLLQNSESHCQQKFNKPRHEVALVSDLPPVRRLPQLSTGFLASPRSYFPYRYRRSTRSSSTSPTSSSYHALHIFFCSLTLWCPKFFRSHLPCCGPKKFFFSCALNYTACPNIFLCALTLLTHRLFFFSFALRLRVPYPAAPYTTLLGAKKNFFVRLPCGAQKKIFFGAHLPCCALNFFSLCELTLLYPHFFCAHLPC